MAIQVFGVTHTTLRAHCFPQQRNEFSANSNPTSTVVGQMIDSAAAEVAGYLRSEGLEADDLAASSGSTYPESYAWCAETVRLGAAYRVARSMTGADPEVVKAWKAEYTGRLKYLDEHGASALGDAPLPVQQSNGPRTHITSQALELGESTDASTLVPTFRMDDSL